MHRAAPRHAEFLAVEGADHNDFFLVAGDDYFMGLAEKVRQWIGGP